MDNTTTCTQIKSKTNELFYNAIHSTNLDAFEAVKHCIIPQKQELREEEPSVDIFKDIHEKNRALDTIRADLALVSNEQETLVRGPHKTASKEETVTLDELPLIVKQAAEAAMLQQYAPKRTVRRNVK